MNAGYYILARGWQDHPVFTGDKHCRRAAWIWLIENAAWAPHRRSIQGKTIELQRGQLTASLRFLAKAWGRDDPWVRRLLARLQADALIDATPDAGQYVLTILNYDKYQDRPREPDAPSNAPLDAAATQERRSSDAKYNSENPGNPINQTVPYGTASGESNGELFDLRKQVFDRGRAFLIRKGIGAKQAGSLLGQWRKGNTDEAILVALRKAEAEDAQEPVSFITACLKGPHNGSDRRTTGKPDRLESILGGARGAMGRQ